MLARKTKKKFKSMRAMKKAATRDKLSKKDVKKIKDLEDKIEFAEKEFEKVRTNSNEQIKKMQQEVKILENPHLKKCVEMTEFVNSEFEETIKDILADERFKHLTENQFDLSVRPGRNGGYIYVSLNADLNVDEIKEKVKLFKEDDDDDFYDDENDEDEEEEDNDDDE